MLGIFGLIVFFVFKACSEEPRVLTKEEIHTQNIEKYFNAWDGSHLRLTELIKETLNDPNSFEHLETTYIDKRNYIIVTTIFTAKNGFGGRVKKEVIARCDTIGNVTAIIKSY